jgi:hypothetical protein
MDDAGVCWRRLGPAAHPRPMGPNFPNLFLLYGPGTNLAHGASIILHSECQVQYAREAYEPRATARQCAARGFWSSSTCWNVGRFVVRIVWGIRPGVKPVREAWLSHVLGSDPKVAERLTAA